MGHRFARIRAGHSWLYCVVRYRAWEWHGARQFHGRLCPRRARPRRAGDRSGGFARPSRLDDGGNNGLGSCAIIICDRRWRRSAAAFGDGGHRWARFLDYTDTSRHARFAPLVRAKAHLIMLKVLRCSAISGNEHLSGLGSTQNFGKLCCLQA